MMTYNSPGPCTPIANVNSMSEVRDGPVMNVTVRLKPAGPCSPIACSTSPNVCRTCAASMIATCTGGTSDDRRCRSRSDSSTSVPVSATAHCALVMPMSQANNSGGSVCANCTASDLICAHTFCTNGASETAMRCACFCLMICCTASAAALSSLTTMQCPPTAASAS